MLSENVIFVDIVNESGNLMLKIRLKLLRRYIQPPTGIVSFNLKKGMNFYSLKIHFQHQNTLKIWRVIKQFNVES